MAIVTKFSSPMINATKKLVLSQSTLQTATKSLLSPDDTSVVTTLIALPTANLLVSSPIRFPKEKIFFYNNQHYYHNQHYN